MHRRGAQGKTMGGAIQEQLLYRNVKRFRGGLVCKAPTLLYHSREMEKKKRADRIGLVCKAPRLLHHATLGVRVTKKKK